MSSPKPSFVIRYLGPLVPLGFAAFGIWILISGSYIYRPGRTTSTVTLLPPDAQISGVFFLSIAALISALGVSGRNKRWLFWIGLVGSIGTLAIEGARQIAGIAVYG
jgi:hypothetical protein